MKSLHTSLLREKFVISDPKLAGKKHAATIALSNRMVLDLVNAQDALHEGFVIRAQNMHSVARMAAFIIGEYEKNGPLISRGINWQKAWESTLTAHEAKYNAERWLAVYHKGRRIFAAKENKVHPFLDMIEKCDFGNTDNYDHAIPLAQELLKQTGKPIDMKYDANVALNVSIDNNEARIGVIVRGSVKTTTFNFSAKPRYENDTLDIPLCLNTASLFLEGVQLAFTVGMNAQKIKLGIVERLTDEHKRARAERERLETLQDEAEDLGTVLDIHYRPERPDFLKLASKAEAKARRLLLPPDDDDEYVY